VSHPSPDTEYIRDQLQALGCNVVGPVYSPRRALELAGSASTSCKTGVMVGPSLEKLSLLRSSMMRPASDRDNPLAMHCSVEPRRRQHFVASQTARSVSTADRTIRMEP
jgi:hypothetical protein